MRGEIGVIFGNRKEVEGLPQIVWVEVDVNLSLSDIVE